MAPGSHYNRQSRYINKQLRGYPFEGPELDPFQSSYGYTVPDLTPGQLQSLAQIEGLAATPGAQGQKSSSEIAAGRTVEDIMSRRPDSPIWDDWFDTNVSAPLRRDLGRDDITRGRAFAGGGNFFGSDREVSDLKGREAFWNELAGARSNAAIQNESLRLQAASLVPSFRNEQQVVKDRMDLLNNIFEAQGQPRKVEQSRIQAELDEYMRQIEWLHQWIGYQLTPLTGQSTNRTPGGSGATGPTTAAAGSVIEAAGAAYGCWVAEAVFGKQALGTLLLRAWFRGYVPKRGGWRLALSRVYSRYGERFAAAVERNRMLRAAMTPIMRRLFNIAVGDLMGVYHGR